MVRGCKEGIIGQFPHFLKYPFETLSKEKHFRRANLLQRKIKLDLLHLQIVMGLTLTKFKEDNESLNEKGRKEGRKKKKN